MSFSVNGLRRFPPDVVCIQIWRQVDAIDGHWGVWYVIQLVFSSSVLHTFTTAFAFGLSIRFGLHSQPESKGLYILEYLFVVLSVRLNIPLYFLSQAKYLHYPVAVRLHCRRLRSSGPSS
jgi:hypothetical protein